MIWVVPAAVAALAAIVVLAAAARLAEEVSRTMAALQATIDRLGDETTRTAAATAETRAHMNRLRRGFSALRR